MGSYVKCEQFGIVAIIFDKRLGDIDAEWAKGRAPVDAKAHGNARPPGVAKENLFERRHFKQNRLPRAAGDVQSLLRHCARRVIAATPKPIWQIISDRVCHAENRPSHGKNGGPKAHFARTRSQGNLKLQPAEIISAATQRVIDHLIARCNEITCIIIKLALNSRANAANVKAWKLRLPKEIAVRQPSLVQSFSSALLKTLDKAAFGRCGENKIPKGSPILARLSIRPQIFNAAAQPCKILAKQNAVAARGTNTIVQSVINKAVPDGRCRPLANSIAQISTGQIRIALAIKVIGRRIQRHIIIAQAITRRETPKFSDRHAHTQLNSRRLLLICRLTTLINEIEGIQIAAENISPECDIFVEEVRFGKAKFNRFGILRIVDTCPQFLPLAAEVPLANRKVDDEPLKRGETSR